MNDRYILPDNIESINEADEWWKRFMTLSPRLRNESNIYSIDTYGKNNYQRYHELKNRLSNNKIIKETADIEDSIDHEDPSNNYLLSCTEDEWDTMLLRARNAETKGLIMMINTNSNSRIKDYTLEDLKVLETKWSTLQTLSQDRRILCSQTAKDILGYENQFLYSMIKTYIMNKAQKETINDTMDNQEVRKFISVQVESGDMLGKEIQSMEDDTGYIENLYKQEEDKLPKEESPYFTPDEMEKMKVYSSNSSDNVYHMPPDIDQLTDGTPISKWYDIYKYYGGRILPRPYAWYRTMQRLYVDKRKIENSGDEKAINSRKQSILNLGGNPEVNFNYCNRSSLSFEHRYVDLSGYYDSYANNNEDDDIVGEGYTPILFLLYYDENDKLIFSKIRIDGTDVLANTYTNDDYPLLKDKVKLSVLGSFIDKNQAITICNNQTEIGMDRVHYYRNPELDMNDLSEMTLCIVLLYNLAEDLKKFSNIDIKYNNQITFYKLYNGLNDDFEHNKGIKIVCNMMNDIVNGVSEIDYDPYDKDKYIDDLSESYSSRDSIYKTRCIIESGSIYDDKHQKQASNLMNINHSAIKKLI